MDRVLLVGAGSVGFVIAQMLAESGDYEVVLADRDQAKLQRELPRNVVVHGLTDASDAAELGRAMRGCFAVVNAGPFAITGAVARSAHASGIHYLDLTEDVAASRDVRELAQTARAAMIPQCGLAPGFISVLGMSLASEFDQLESLYLRVGSLPQYPTNRLRYNLMWNIASFVNEYTQACEVIVGGKRTLASALDGFEEFVLNGILYEAFDTSGGLGTLCETLVGKVQTMNYRTIRYPGHREAMLFLLRDLRLSERPELLQEILSAGIPATTQDLVVIFATAIGMKHGRRMQRSYAHRVYAGHGGTPYMAIQITTAAAACTTLDLLRDGKLPQRGFVRQEDIGLQDFLANRFGATYAGTVT